MIVLKLCLVLLLVTASHTLYDDVLQSVLESINAEKIGSYIQRISAKPRNTGSDWNKQVGEDLKREWAAFGLKVVSKKYKVMQSFPKKKDPSFAELLNSKGEVQQTFREDGEPEKGILPAFNAFSKAGSAEGKPVYVNYGRKEDFAFLKETGVQMKGCIGLARYGKIYRGDKAALAEQYGMAGLIIYNDGADYAPQGEDDTWPNGAGLPYSGIQRGTLLNVMGDPSTYLYPSTEYASHDTGKDLASRLPGIVVMPISFENALLVLKKMKGDTVSKDWQGGGSKEYKYGPGFSGSKFDRLKITVNIESKLVEVENIFGIIKGDREPDRWVMMGNHRDTWVQGAVDASTGLATMYEIARALSPHLKSGWRPRRTLVLASWAAEEQGVMGSTEFVEDYRALLSEKAVAYINVDCPVTGNLTFKPHATPNFKPLLERVTKDMKANMPGYKSFYDQWVKSSNSSEGKVEAGILGSGSDFAAFLQIVGVSAIDLHQKGPYYTYHTQYDNFDYFKTHIDPGFGAMKSITQVAARLFIDLSCSKIIPLNAASYATRVLSVFQEVRKKVDSDLQAQGISLTSLDQTLNEFVTQAQLFEKRKNALRTAKNNWLDVRRINDKIQQLERSFINPTGLPGRPNNRHMLFAPSVTNSYGGAVFPGIQDCVVYAKDSGREEDWNEVRKQITIATWVTKAAIRTLSNQAFPKM